MRLKSKQVLGRDVIIKWIVNKDANDLLNNNILFAYHGKNENMTNAF